METSIRVLADLIDVTVGPTDVANIGKENATTKQQATKVTPHSVIVWEEATGIAFPIHKTMHEK